MLKQATSSSSEANDSSCDGFAVKGEAAEASQAWYFQPRWSWRWTAFCSYFKPKLFSLSGVWLTRCVLQQSTSFHSACAMDFINTWSDFSSRLSNLFVKPREVGINYEQEQKRSLVISLKASRATCESTLLLVFFVVIVQRDPAALIEVPFTKELENSVSSHTWNNRFLPWAYSSLLSCVRCAKEDICFLMANWKLVWPSFTERVWNLSLTLQLSFDTFLTNQSLPMTAF